MIWLGGVNIIAGIYDGICTCSEQCLLVCSGDPVMTGLW